jgi:hypothetical protein
VADFVFIFCLVQQPFVIRYAPRDLSHLAIPFSACLIAPITPLQSFAFYENKSDAQKITDQKSGLKHTLSSRSINAGQKIQHSEALQVLKNASDVAVVT